MDRELREFLIGSCLGDGCFVKKSENHNTYAVFSHCASQLGWLTWKYEFLKALGYIKKGKEIKQVNLDSRHCFPNPQPQYKFSTTSSEDFNFVKTLSDDAIADDFGILSLVVWLLDDGNVCGRTIKIAAGKKSEYLCMRLMGRIQDLTGAESVYYIHPTNPVKNYIRILTKDFQKIKDAVLCYVPAEVDIVHDKFKVESDSVQVKIKYHNGEESTALMPNSDWIDLRAAETVEMKAGEYRQISLGVSMQLPVNFEAHVAPRSSTFKRWGILLVNGIGIIDNSFCGDNDVWSFPAFAVRDTKIEKGERICQFRIMRKQPVIKFVEVETLGNPDRHGIGSTGRV